MQTLPIPIKNALRKLGSDIRDARLRRRIPVAVMAQRAFISRTTLVKLEKGFSLVIIPVDKAVYCRTCKSITNSPSERCGKCGSEFVLRLATLIRSTAQWSRLGSGLARLHCSD
jgi:DNA-binding XRE family transcriptional regulator